jgi:single-strand DNA-binding protein
MNKVFLIGNLTRDPELTETNSGTSLCRFSIAVNRNYSGSDGERKTDFFNIVAWRSLGENVSRYAKKGNKVAVIGSIELRNYEDNQGVKRTAVDIVAQDVEFLTPKSGSGEYTPSESAPAPQEKKRATLQSFDDDSDIPF